MKLSASAEPGSLWFTCYSQFVEGYRAVLLIYVEEMNDLTI